MSKHASWTDRYREAPPEPALPPAQVCEACWGNATGDRCTVCAGYGRTIRVRGATYPDNHRGRKQARQALLAGQGEAGS